MKNLTPLIICLLSISIVSCKQNKEYEITGNVTGFPDSTMVYLRNLQTDEIIDSALVISNKFQLKGHLENEPERLLLIARVDKEYYHNFLLIGNEKVTIEADIHDFPWNVKISGSKTQDERNDLQNLTKSLDMERDSLVNYFMALPTDKRLEKRTEIWERVHEIDSITKSITMDFIKSHIDTYEAMIRLAYLKNSIPKDTLQALFNQVSEEIKSSKYGKVISIYLNEKVPEIGDYYHDFKAINSSGDSIKFSDFLGKYILLDFTAAYCGACIQSTKELRLIDTTYSDSLQIVGFNTDAKKEVWLSSLKRDSVSWISLWDGKGSYSKTYIKYGINSFPTFYLFAPDGKVIDKWVGYGKGSLQNKLKRFRKD